MFQGLVMWSAILLVSVCSVVLGLSRIDPLVSTKGGLIRGLRSEYGYAKFLGVPYAVVDKKNPFGQALPHPGFDDAFEAYESNECPQKGSDGNSFGTIDCLTMNIYVPSVANSRNRLPVMVWIHGGAFVEGSATAEGTEPSFLVRHDVIVVAINYRLGIYGFMCLDIPEVPGNQGLKDQVLALRWINENIEAFGGDAKQITVFGESAGGMSVNLHLLSLNEKLFHRAIIQSAPAFSALIITESNSTVPLLLAKALDYDTDDVNDALEYLATIDPQILVNLADDMKISKLDSNNDFATTPCIEKEFDGVENFIIDHPENIKTAKVSSTPIIIGNNDNEMPFIYGFEYAELFINFSLNLVEAAFDLGSNLDSALENIRHFYIGDAKASEDLRDEIAALASDLLFNHPTQRMAERFLEIGAKTVYRYIFSYAGGRNMVKIHLKLNVTGAVHADELGYLFNMGYFSGPIAPEDQIVIDRLTTLWTNFAKYGDPTPDVTLLLPFKWQTISQTHQPYLSIDSDLTLKSRPFHDRMAFWDLFYLTYKNQLKGINGSKK